MESDVWISTLTKVLCLGELYLLQNGKKNNACLKSFWKSNKAVLKDSGHPWALLFLWVSGTLFIKLHDFEVMLQQPSEDQEEAWKSLVRWKAVV